MKPHFTSTEMQELRKPGKAWEAAKEALKNKDVDRAEALLPFMLKSDQGLMRIRIEAIRAAT